MKLFALLLLAGLALAAKFQFFVERGEDGRVFAAFDTISVADSAGKSLFEGHTDKYGRVSVKVPRGIYRATLRHGGRNYRVPLTVDTVLKLDTIFLRDSLPVAP